MTASLPHCRSCGRPITPRRSHRGEEDVRYCSKRCRARRVSPRDRVLEARLLTRLDACAPHATFCPSEVARANGEDAWRERMEPVRRAARRLAARGELVFTQGGRVVDPATASGPVRLRRPRSGDLDAPRLEAEGERAERGVTARSDGPHGPDPRRTSGPSPPAPSKSGPAGRSR